MILALLAILTIGPVRPDPTLTPGVVRPLTRTQICDTKWGTDRRFVSLAMKKHVFALYGIPYEKHALFEVDHKVPRSLAGADDERNLAPQIWSAAHKKDRLEVKLHRLYCAGDVSLTDAQHAFDDWEAAYLKTFGERP